MRDTLESISATLDEYRDDHPDNEAVQTLVAELAGIVALHEDKTPDGPDDLPERFLRIAKVSKAITDRSTIADDLTGHVLANTITEHEAYQCLALTMLMVAGTVAPFLKGENTKPTPIAHIAAVMKAAVDQFTLIATQAHDTEDTFDA